MSAAQPVEVLERRATVVGGVPVARTLPQRERRMVGPWCLVDRFGPAEAAATPMRVPPHPHIGLATVTWLLDGELLHRDSLGNEQLLRPGQLNVMTAGFGIAHAEESPATARGALEGVQLWIALPASTRLGPPSFAHHPELPVLSIGANSTARILMGEHGGGRSTARTDSPLVAVDLDLTGRAQVPLDPSYEHAVVVCRGDTVVEGQPVTAGETAYLSVGREELTLVSEPTARLLLLGGEPVETPVLLWWNFVARTADEIELAYRDWQAWSPRFGDVGSSLPRATAPMPSWRSPS